MESRVRREVQARFGGEYLENCRSNAASRRVLSLQREGRILRQGNQNAEVSIFNYVTKGTLDSYLYQTVTDKARFIAQLLDDQCPARMSEDCDEKVLTFGEIQAAAEGNPDFRRRIELSNEIAELKLLQSEFLRETGLARSRVENLPKVIAKRDAEVEAVQRDLQKAKQLGDISIWTPDGRTITDRKEMNTFLLRAVNEKLKNPEKEMQPFHIGDFSVSVTTFGDDARFSISGEHPYSCAAGASESQDNVTRLSNYFEKGIAKTAVDLKQDMESMQMNLRQSEERVTMPFQHQAELESKEKEFAELEERLAGLSVQEDAVIDGSPSKIRIITKL